MPRIDDIPQNEKKFIKKSYRPWNFLDDELDIELTQKNESHTNTTEKNIYIKEKPSLTLVKTEEIFETNVRQTKDNVETNLSLNIRQTKDKPGSRLMQTESDILNLGQNLRHNLRQTKDKQDTNLGQTTNNYPFSSLVGLQKLIVLFMYSICKITPDKTTQQLTISHIASTCKTSIGSAHKTIQRLENKEVLYRVSFKNGRGGWTIYKLNELVFQEILYYESHGNLITNMGQTKDKQDTNLRQNDDKVSTEYKTEYRTIPLSSGSNYINTTTDTKDDNFSFSDEWKYIDIEPLIDIGFTESQLKQLAKAGKLTPTEVQESIYAFAYARKQPEITKSIRTNHLNFLMGVLIKKGEPYLPPTGYKSPLDIAIQEDIERKKKKLALEAELNDLKFQEWYNFLAKEEKENLFIQELTDEENELYFGKNARYMPEHVRENKKKEVLRPYFFNKIQL